MKFIFEHEDTAQLMAELHMNWYTDYDTLDAMTYKILSKPMHFAFNSLVSSDKEEFALELLDLYHEKLPIFSEIVKPKLLNWDADRIATIDRILINMGVCELLFFSTIPVKVSINEYIDWPKCLAHLKVVNL
ncbi:MAG: transcription antitermination factor NusB [Chitinophagaceae bacterium]